MRVLPLWVCLIVSAACGLVASPAWAVPPTVLHQARLFDANGAPVTGTHDVTLRLFDAPTGGTQTDSVTLADRSLAVQLVPIP